MEYFHKPVMLSKNLEYLELKEGDKVIDCTLGGGGYTKAFSEQVGKTGRVVAIDLDDKAIENFSRIRQELTHDNVILVQDNFRNLDQIVEEKFGAQSKFKAVVMDLGLSSAQLEDRDRGFSFQEDRPVDMSFSGDSNNTYQILHNYSQAKLREIFIKLGDEKHANKIATNIVKFRQHQNIENTAQLKEIIDNSVNRKAYHKISPYTKVFQALRMETNQELKNLEEVLPQAVKVLEPQGRLITVSFHSGEDRIVKNFFRQEATDCICPKEFPICTCGHKAQLEIVTKKPLVPDDQELEDNPRARSAKLRIAQKLT